MSRHNHVQVRMFGSSRRPFLSRKDDVSPLPESLKTPAEENCTWHAPERSTPDEYPQGLVYAGMGGDEMPELALICEGGVPYEITEDSHACV